MPLQFFWLFLEECTSDFSWQFQFCYFAILLKRTNILTDISNNTLNL